MTHTASLGKIQKLHTYASSVVDCSLAKICNYLRRISLCVLEFPAGDTVRREGRMEKERRGNSWINAKRKEKRRDKEMLRGQGSCKQRDKDMDKSAPIKDLTEQTSCKLSESLSI